MSENDDLGAALRSKDINALWSALARTTKREGAPFLAEALLADWHESHEDIVFELGLIGDARTTESVAKAAVTTFEYMVKWDNLHEFQRKCAYALVRIGSAESRAALEVLAKHPDPHFREYGEEGLALRYAYMKRPKLRGLWPILAMSAALVSNSFAKTPMPPPDVSPQAPVVALWSDQVIRNAHGVVPVIWVFQEPIECSQFTWYPQNSLMLTPNRPLADGEYSYSIPAELPICMEFDANLKGVRCRDGEIDLQFFKDAAEYRGVYTLTMDDGSTRNGKFRAQYCPKRP